MSKPVIQLDHVAKSYRLGRVIRSPYQLARDLLRRTISPPARSNRPKPEDQILWAVRDVSFNVHPGEVLGIIGRNGAGKSTILKLLSRITGPTHGRITMRGRVASLLEVGTGFHPELTGRDNIFLNGSVLGMTRAEIKRRFDDIVQFADVQRFLDTPVKRYSSGMFVRLAFAVAAHLDPEIMVIDEVLAVGDVAFQQKCLGKMQSIANGGRTVLFVSHNMSAINQFCSRAIRMQGGKLIDDDNPASVVAKYITESFAAQRLREYPPNANKRITIRKLEIEGAPEGPGGLLYRANPFDVRLTFDVNQPITGSAIGVTLERPDGTPVCQSRDVDCLENDEISFEPGTYTNTVRFPGALLNAGTYTLRATVEWAGGREPIDHQEGITFELYDADGISLRNSRGRRRPGVLLLNLPWQTTVTDHSAATQTPNPIPNAQNPALAGERA